MATRQARARPSTAAASAGGRPPPPSKRDAILKAATRVFLESGYGAASMDEIAREAGVSKQTVYRHFGDKEALFGATIREKCDHLLAPILVPEPESDDPGVALTAIAGRFVGLILAQENMAHFRAVVAESTRFPELAAAFHASGPRLAVRYLAGYLGEVDAKGRLAVDDPEQAARLFFAMLRGEIYMRRLLGLGPEPTQDEVDASVDLAVRVFLAGYACE